eukprot:CAMPEP_0174856636 /NCGR_PEP_ID=MMETSP1114-20130205/36142_1 /TAXON_ID=312471 /ORGANISM="Neobodo designis, Strain CCAP 1951/1" /LENGTH=1085 /DNA_ID=CAMNT_0016091441 /DNA_START=80 /DNA_END=3337 /DNA_ORIENTATION=-
MARGVNDIKLRTIADAVGTDSDDHTPEELYIVNPPSKRPAISGKWILDPIAHAEAAAAEEGADASVAGAAAAAAKKRRAEAQNDGGDAAGGRGSGNGSEKFPTHEELMLLPAEIQSTLLQLVKDYFRRKVYPRLVFLSRRKQTRAAVAQARVSAPHVSPGFITSVPLFARWPGIESIARTMRLVVLERGQMLTYEGETNPIGAFFLVQGTMQARKKRPAAQLVPVSPLNPGIVRGVNGKPVSRKSLGPNNTTVTGTYEAPMCYGEMTLLTEEPRMESLRAVTRCLVWVFDRASFFSQLNSLPADRRAAVTEVAFQQRRENIPKVFPVTGASLAKVHLFSHIPVDRLDALAPRLEPRVFQEGQVICNIGDVGTEMFLIVRGHMNVAVVSSEGAGTMRDNNSNALSPHAGSSPTGGNGGERDSVESVSGAGSVVGEMSVLFSQKRNCQLIALTTCDVYAMTRDMIVSAVTNQKHMTLLLQKAHSIQAQRQKHAKGRFAEFISQIPMCREVATTEMNAALLEGFTSKVYPPHSTVVTVSECADRIVIIVRGHARLTANSRDLAIGECVGFTCLIPHRWCYHVVALDTVETIELGCDAFMAIAKQHGVFKELKALTLGLLYPRVYPDDFQRAFAMVKALPGPPSFPSSSGYEVKPFAARVTDKPSLPYNALKRRPRTDAGLHIAADDEATQFVPPPPKLSAKLPDDDDDAAARRRKSLATSIERDEDDDAVSNAGQDGSGTVQQNPQQLSSAGPHSSAPAGNATSAARSQRDASKARDAQLVADRRQRSRQEEIDRLAAKIQELHRKGVSMAGSPARSTRRAKASSTDASPKKEPAAAEEKETRTVAIQTAKSYLMTRYKMRTSQLRGEDAAKAEAAEASPTRQPDNCGHEASGDSNNDQAESAAPAPADGQEASGDGNNDAESTAPAPAPADGDAGNENAASNEAEETTAVAGAEESPSATEHAEPANDGEQVVEDGGGDAAAAQSEGQSSKPADAEHSGAAQTDDADKPNVEDAQEDASENSKSVEAEQDSSMQPNEASAEDADATDAAAAANDDKSPAESRAADDAKPASDAEKPAKKRTKASKKK